MKKKTKKKRNLSPATRKRLARQARINFGLSRSKKRRSNVAKRRKARRTYRRASTYGKVVSLAIGGVAYGALRNRISNWLSQFTGSVPLGNASDEVVMLGANYLVGKMVKDKTVKRITDVGMGVEFARLGDLISSGSLTTSSTNTNGLIF